MPKYEIMLIVDPQQLSEAENISKEVFGKNIIKYEKLDRTELSYEINKTKIANYVLMEVNTLGENIKEFTRRANISKSIWRNLIINLDSERKINTKMTPEQMEENRKAFIEKRNQKFAARNNQRENIEEK